MKRLFAFILGIAVLFCFFGCDEKEDFVFSSSGVYTVQPEDSNIVFKATIDGECKSFEFVSPQSIKGMKVISYDGVSYSVEYGELKFVTDSRAVKAATDFAAALEFLERAGEYSGGRMYASIDGMAAEGLFQDGKICDLAFTDGIKGRNYKIKTEATG